MNAIPTTYAGVRFRSRLEAKWAAFFDLVGWRWDYEPLDLAGYIPDFILHLAKPVLVEVKPLMWTESAEERQQLAHTRSKVDAAGWVGEALIVGACLAPADQCSERFREGFFRFGRMREQDIVQYESCTTALNCRDPRCIAIAHRRPTGPRYCWDYAVAFSCGECGLASFCHDSMSWSCRASGCYEQSAGARLQPWDAVADFRAASNRVQWRAA